MSNGVVFNEEDTGNIVGNIAIVPGAPNGVLAWLVKSKVAHDAQQAEKILLGILVLIVLLAVGILAFGRGKSSLDASVKDRQDATRNQQQFHAPN